MNLAPGGWRYVGVLAGFAILLVVVSPWVSFGLFALSGFVLWFYRDPDRAIPPAGILAPADGKITVIRTEDEQVRIGVFMNIIDVHVNRAPTRGTIAKITHTSGAHRPAFSKESERNERVTIEFDTYSLILIAGWFARRIRTYVEEGDTVDRGDRIGHIAFGSRVDVRLPPPVEREDLLVREGDRVKAGETLIVREPSGDGHTE